MKIDAETMKSKKAYVAKRVKERKVITLTELQAELQEKFGHRMGHKTLSTTIAAARAEKGE